MVMFEVDLIWLSCLLDRVGMWGRKDHNWDLIIAATQVVKHRHIQGVTTATASPMVQTVCFKEFKEGTEKYPELAQEMAKIHPKDINRKYWLLYRVLYAH